MEGKIRLGTSTCLLGEPALRSGINLRGLSAGPLHPADVSEIADRTASLFVRTGLERDRRIDDLSKERKDDRPQPSVPFVVMARKAEEGNLHLFAEGPPAEEEIQGV